MLTRTATVFSGFPGAFVGLVVSVVFLKNTVGLCETRVASWVVDVTSSGCSVDFAETCIVFGLASVVSCSTGIPWAPVVLSLAETISLSY